MAKIVDTKKLEGIKQSAVRLIVENGYGGASISNIAKKAKVADGYLYRFYKSKEELVNDLLNSKITEVADKLEEAMREAGSFTHIIELLVKGIFKIAEKSFDDIKFIYVMMNDYSFSINSKIKDRLSSLCAEIKEKGKLMSQIDDLISEEEIYMFLVVYPIQFINLRIKKFIGIADWTENDIQRVISICNKTLKK